MNCGCPSISFSELSPQAWYSLLDVGQQRQTPLMILLLLLLVQSECTRLTTITIQYPYLHPHHVPTSPHKTLKVPIANAIESARTAQTSSVGYDVPTARLILVLITGPPTMVVVAFPPPYPVPLPYTPPLPPPPPDELPFPPYPPPVPFPPTPGNKLVVFSSMTI